MVKFGIWALAIGLLGAVATLPKVLPLLGGQVKRPVAVADGASGRRAASKRGDASGSDNARPLRVATYVVHPQPLAEIVTSTGTLRADESVELQSESNGKVVAINFTEGTSVHRGDLLLKINDADLRAMLERAAASQKLAELRERRFATLLKQGVVTQNDYDTALSDLNVQTAGIALIEAQIAKTEVRAPFDGVVGLRFVSIGAFVNATTRIATLQHLDKLKIDFSVPERYAGRIRVGSPVTFSVAGGDSRIKGEIYATDPRVDSGTRTVLIRAVCRNERGRLLPGAFASVELTLSEVIDAMLIPAEAVIPGLDAKEVFVIEDGKAVRRTVETGTRTTSAIQVLAGLHVGDVVITSGLVQLRPGQAVNPLEAAQPALVADKSAQP